MRTLLGFLILFVACSTSQARSVKAIAAENSYLDLVAIENENVIFDVTFTLKCNQAFLKTKIVQLGETQESWTEFCAGAVVEEDGDSSCDKTTSTEVTRPLVAPIARFPNIRISDLAQKNCAAVPIP